MATSVEEGRRQWEEYKEKSRYKVWVVIRTDLLCKLPKEWLREHEDWPPSGPGEHYGGWLEEDSGYWPFEIFIDEKDFVRFHYLSSVVDKDGVFMKLEQKAIRNPRWVGSATFMVATPLTPEETTVYNEWWEKYGRL